MTRLTELRKRLARLKRRRQRTRWATAYSALALALLWILAAAFLVDWLFEMNWIQRAISLLLCTGIAVWAFWRWSLPWLGHRENELDMALLVERRHHIDTDLVAAVQFESPEAPAWGSLQLEQAVVDTIAATSKRLNVMSVLSQRELGRRTLLLLATAAVWAALACACTEHVRAFFNRLLLGSRHYPTRTAIDAIKINGIAVDPDDTASAEVTVHRGENAEFEVMLSGDLPEEGNCVELLTVKGGTPKPIELTPVAKGSCVYRGQWKRVVEPMDYQVLVGTAWAERTWLGGLGILLGQRRGKAWTEPARLEVIQPPDIRVELEVVPPQYATKDSDPLRMPAGLLQISVVEGSQVIVKLSSDKYLKEAFLSIKGQAGTYQFAHQKPTDSEDDRDRWVLDPKGTPLGAVVDQIQYAIQVKDAYGRRSEPRDGTIRIQADNPPRIEAKTNTPFVLPAARPAIHFAAVDDYGLDRVSAIREVIHKNNDIEKDEVEIYKLLPGQRLLRVIRDTTKDAAGKPYTPYILDLAEVKLKEGKKLVKGDKVRVTLQAEDYRGKRQGKQALSEPLVFQVTDEQGILEGMQEYDRKSAQQLQTMIQRQLGIGGEFP